MYTTRCHVASVNQPAMRTDFNMLALATTRKCPSSSIIPYLCSPGCAHEVSVMARPTSTKRKIATSKNVCADSHTKRSPPLSTLRLPRTALWAGSSRTASQGPWETPSWASTSGTTWPLATRSHWSMTANVDSGERNMDAQFKNECYF